MRPSNILSLLVSATVTGVLAVWILRHQSHPVGLAAFAASGLWFVVCLIRTLGNRLSGSAPDFTQGAGFGRIPARTSGAPGPRGAIGMSQKPSDSATQSPHDADEPLISLVLLLSEPRSPTEATISACVASALDVDLDPEDLHATQFVIRMPTQSRPRGSQPSVDHFMVKLDCGVFAVLCSARPYIENHRYAGGQKIHDKRLRSAIDSHTAWLSIDLMDKPGSEEEKRDAYRAIGRMLAAMTGPDCVAVCCPELQLCNEFEPGLIEALRSDEPLNLFSDPTFAPVIEVSRDDPAMVAAVQEARERWPEFLAAFDPDREDDRFLVKAEFRDGDNAEFMWIQVSRASAESVTGLLVNEPHELENVHCGQSVTVPFELLNDWVCPDDDGHMVGGFTLQIIADAEGSDE